MVALKKISQYHLSGFKLPVQFIYSIPTLFIIAILAWLFSEIIGSRIIPAWRARGSVQAGAPKRGSTPLIFMSLSIAIFLVFALRSHGLVNLPVWSWYLGILLVFAGIAVRQWAIATLGRFFNVRVRLLKDHHVVTSGPYRLVRHPSYTGLLIIIFGISLTSASWEGVIVIMAAIGISLWYRIRVEERFLTKELGRDYAEYRKHTKYLIPFLL